MYIQYQNDIFSVSASSDNAVCALSEPVCIENGCEITVPFLAEENGHTLQFASVDWQSDNTANVDAHAITDRYTAVVTYEGTGTRSYSKGYTVTAEYNGIVSKTATDTVQYTAIYAQENAFPIDLNMILLPLCGAGIALAGMVVFQSMKKRKGESADEHSESIENDESNAADSVDPDDDNSDNYPGVCP